jgi:hypothetical protein
MHRDPKPDKQPEFETNRGAGNSTIASARPGAAASSSQTLPALRSPALASAPGKPRRIIREQVDGPPPLPFLTIEEGETAGQ